MPLVAVVSESYICMHGGISPELKTIQDISSFSRFSDIPEEGLMTDILWSDPMDDKDAPKASFEKNKDRDCSVKYG